jgi:hypothetical protein
MDALCSKWEQQEEEEEDEKEEDEEEEDEDEEEEEEKTQLGVILFNYLLAIRFSKNIRLPFSLLGLFAFCLLPQNMQCL